MYRTRFLGHPVTLRGLTQLVFLARFERRAVRQLLEAPAPIVPFDEPGDGGAHFGQVGRPGRPAATSPLHRSRPPPGPRPHLQIDLSSEPLVRDRPLLPTAPNGSKPTHTNLRRARKLGVPRQLFRKSVVCRCPA